MITIQELFRVEKDALAKQLAAAPDVNDAVRTIQNCFDRMKQDYIAKQDDSELRYKAIALFGVARRALSACEAVRETRLFQNLPVARLPAYAKRMRWPEVLTHVLPPALCAVVCLMLLFISKNVPWIIVSVIATLGSVYQAFRLWPRPEKHKESSRADVKAEIQVNTPALLTYVELICTEMDNQLKKRETGKDDNDKRPLWTKDQVTAAQILWEALRSKDGAYALSAVPSLLNGFEKQGIRITLYSQETAEYFEAVPAVSDGETVRPALVADKTIIACGQVTAAMLDNISD